MGNKILKYFVLSVCVVTLGFTMSYGGVDEMINNIRTWLYDNDNRDTINLPRDVWIPYRGWCRPCTRLFYAVHVDGIELVIILLKKGADPEMVVSHFEPCWGCGFDEVRMTPLQLAEYKGRSDMVKLFNEVKAEKEKQKKEREINQFRLKRESEEQ